MYGYEGVPYDGYGYPAGYVDDGSGVAGGLPMYKAAILLENPDAAAALHGLYGGLDGYGGGLDGGLGLGALGGLGLGLGGMGGGVNDVEGLNEAIRKSGFPGLTPTQLYRLRTIAATNYGAHYAQGIGRSRDAEGTNGYHGGGYYDGYGTYGASNGYAGGYPNGYGGLDGFSDDDGMGGGAGPPFGGLDLETLDDLAGRIGADDSFRYTPPTQTTHTHTHAHTHTHTYRQTQTDIRTHTHAHTHTRTPHLTPPHHLTSPPHPHRSARPSTSSRASQAVTTSKIR